MKGITFTLRVRGLIKNLRNELVFLRQKLAGMTFLVLPGGEINGNEMLEAALKREIIEETGLVVDNFRLVAIREIIIKDYYRNIDYFFLVERFHGQLIAGNDPERVEQTIEDALWVKRSDNLETFPEFVWEILDGNNVIIKKEELTVVDYLKRYRVLPEPEEGKNELVYVMLKPDSIEHNLEDVLTEELKSLGTSLCARQEMIITEGQFRAIYPDFNYPSAQKLVSDYLTTYPTVHLVFLGSSGAHAEFNRAKGKTGTGEGLRSRYITWFTKLDSESYKNWLDGKHEKQQQISLEMFCRNLLHVSPNIATSLKSMEVIFK